ncbi:MAG TPA: glutamate racemase [Candidatus Acidoferrum sp.]|nr:glutamate racemase [Candidatus Acidoferrum sp.]
MSTAPIGVFDSGIGGLSILHGIRTLSPNEALIYVSDAAHAPYGPKGEDFIRQRSVHLMDALIARGAKAIVVACNTATAAAIALLRERYPLPIIGVEPAVKPAAAQSRSGVVGVLATSGTIASDKFLTLQNRFSDRVRILTRAGTGLVELIERPDSEERVLMTLLHSYIEPMVEQGADALVLGCTHYSLIKRQIAAVADSRMKIIDAGTAVAEELQRRLAAGGLASNAIGKGKVEFFTSGEPAVLRRLLARYWSEPADVTALV